MASWSARTNVLFFSCSPASSFSPIALIGIGIGERVVASVQQSREELAHCAAGTQKCETPYKREYIRQECQAYVAEHLY